MAELQIDAGQLNGAAGQMRSVMQEVQATTSNLNAAANSASSGWQGQSESSFMDLWRRWSNAMNQLATAIEETASHLDQAASIYEETDQTALQTSATASPN